jgi:hypothetical protein
MVERQEGGEAGRWEGMWRGRGLERQEGEEAGG